MRLEQEFLAGQDRGKKQTNKTKTKNKTKKQKKEGRKKQGRKEKFIGMGKILFSWKKLCYGVLLPTCK